MSGKQSVSALAILVLFLIAGACNFNFSTAHITDAKMSKTVNDNKEAVNPTTTFESTDPVIHAVIEIGNAPDDTRVKAKWTAVKVQGFEPNHHIDETEIKTQGKNIVDFTLTPTGGLPPGDYKVDIFLNPTADKEKAPDKTLTFTVTGGSGAGAPSSASPTGSSSATISDVRIATEEGGDAVESVGTDTAKIYCRVRFTGPAPGTKVTAHWIAEKAEGVEPNYEIAKTSVTLEGEQNYIDFTITKPTNGFPVGTYRVDLNMNESTSVAKSISFDIEE